MNYKIYKPFSTKKASAGYTLMELLIGAAIATVVISAAGFGLVQIMRASQKEGAEKERQEEVARAYNFISDEIRRARVIEDDSNVATDATTFNSTGKEVVLVLKIPVPDIDVNEDGTVDANDNRDRDGVDNNEANVIYYVSNPATSTWKGPKVLYRWGPALSGGGEYTTGDWGYEALIDKLDNTTITPTCETGWTASSAPGFAACIDPNNKTAQLFINGKIATAGGYNATYKSADTKTVARANSDSSVAGASIPNSIRDFDGSFECMTPDTSKPQPPSVITGMTFYDSSGNAVIGSTVNADDGTSLTPTKTLSAGGSFKFGDYRKDKIKVDAISQGCTPSTNPVQNVAPVSVTIDIDSSGNPTPTGDTSKVKILRNGDILSSELITNSFPNQDSFIKFLKDRGVTINWTDTDGDGVGGVDGEYTGTVGEEDPDDQYTIVLNDDELLIAFEIGQNSDTLAGGVDNPGFDFQDKLVLITSDALNP